MKAQVLERRKRGLYKTYVLDSSLPIPRTTAWNWRNKGRMINRNALLIEESQPADGVSDISTLESALDESKDEDTYLEEEYSDVESELEQGEDTRSDNYESNKEEDNPDEREEGNVETHDDNERQCNDEAKQDEPLYSGARTTKAQSVLLIMTFVMRSGLSKEGLKYLLELMNILLPSDNSLPTSCYLLKKCFKTGSSLVKFYCDVCYSLFESGSTVCVSCGKIGSCEELTSSGNYFLHMPIQCQLKDILQKQGLGEHLQYKYVRNIDDSHSVSDIYDGRCYKMLERENGEDFVSLQFNFDGVPVFKSSSFSMHPILLFINELPPWLRKKNATLAGLWFGTMKPVINTFFQTLVDEGKQLAETGLMWNFNGEPKVTKVFVTIATCDSIARCTLQNIKQFNGYYGCNWCLSRGELAEKGNGTVHIYPADACEIRTHDGTMKCAAKVVASNSCEMGVKGPSPLIGLPKFDIVKNFVVDYMHCVDLGITRQLVTLWLDSCNHDKPWYIGLHTEALDEKMRKIVVPCNITRRPRSFVVRKYWKASEWRAFLLFYVVVCRGILPSKYLKHVMLLSSAMFILLKESISQIEICDAERYLIKFVKDFQVLYGRENMTFNVHILHHVPFSVRNWGPLWAYSAYGFEGLNGKLLGMFHGTQAVPKQITDTFLLMHDIRNKCSNLKDNCSNEVQIILQKMLGNSYVFGHKMCNGVFFLGNPCFKILTTDYQYLLEGIFSCSLNQVAEIYNRALVRGQLYCAKGSQRTTRRQNYLVEVDQTIVEISKFVRCKNRGGVFYFAAIGKVVAHSQLPIFGKDVECGADASHIKAISSAALLVQETRVFDVNSIKNKCVLIESDDMNVVCKLPNNLERD